ncbi:hypothetical protein N7451_000434 [Penicillium sp. IBT 35674x]|nr:hypothetical protein N7451_000434 [Penicillium sp. IBT 35674x]
MDQYPYLFAASTAFIAPLRSSWVKRHGATWRLADSLRVSSDGHLLQWCSVTARIFESYVVHGYPMTFASASPKTEVTAPLQNSCVI